MMLLSTLALFIYLLFFKNTLGDPLYYLLGSFGWKYQFFDGFTMLSAIASKAGNNGTIMAILCFPIIIPVILLLVRFSKNAMDGLERSASGHDLIVLAAINAIVYSNFFGLFPYLWRD